MDETIKCYEDIIGLELIRWFHQENLEVVFMGTGTETQIEFLYDGNYSEEYIEERICWGFEVDSLDETLKLVANNNIAIFREIVQPNPFVKFFYIKDPNGMVIQFVENIKQ